MTLSFSISSMLKMAPTAYCKNPQGAVSEVETLSYTIVTFNSKLQKNKKKQFCSAETMTMCIAHLEIKSKGLVSK